MRHLLRNSWNDIRAQSGKGEEARGKLRGYDQRVAGRVVLDRGDLPTGDQTIQRAAAGQPTFPMSKRQLINPRQLQNLWKVKASDRLFGPTVIKILNHLVAGRRECAICVRQSLGECISCDEAQPVRGSLSTHELKRVVSGTSHGWIIVD